MTASEHYPELDVREKIAHIDQMLADIERIYADHDRRRQEIKYAPWQLIATMVGAGAALFAAGGAFVKLIGG